MNLNKNKEKDFVDMPDMQAYENVIRINGDMQAYLVVESFDEYLSRVIPLQSIDEGGHLYDNYIKQLTVDELILQL